MRPRYSFSSRHTKRARKKTTTQKAKFPELLDKVIKNSDIILQVLDARFPEETRNLEIEKQIKKNKKQLIFVLNKADLVKKRSKLKIPNYVYISSTQRKGSKDLREKIKREAKKIERATSDDTQSHKDTINIGVIGYPNTGKSSLINLLIGKASAGTGSEAGYTKGIQKLKLSQGIHLLDSPGVIPESEYSTTKQSALTKHTKVGGRSFSQIKDPELVVTDIMKQHKGVIEKHYKIKAKNSEELIEELGRKKNLLKKGNQVNEDQTARLILKDWQQGKIKI
jgi:ribosome biogenesis GTPase A